MSDRPDFARPAPPPARDPVARAVFAALDLFAPPDTREELVGDLREEWATIVLPERGPAAARKWLVRQAAHSAGPLLALRARRLDIGTRAGAAGAGFTAAALAFALADSAWRFILSLVPLRASHAPPALWTGLVVVLALVLASTAAVLAASFLGLRRRRP